MVTHFCRPPSTERPIFTALGFQIKPLPSDMQTFGIKPGSKYLMVSYTFCVDCNYHESTGFQGPSDGKPHRHEASLSSVVCSTFLDMRNVILGVKRDLKG